VFVVVATAIYAAVNAILQLFMPASGSPNIVPTANAAILAAVVIAIAYSLMGVGGETIFPAPSDQLPRPSLPTSRALPIESYSMP